MKNRMQRNGLIALMVIGSWSAWSQITFYEQYSNSGYDYGQGITQTEDSSYLVTGSSSSFTDGPSQAFLLKTDSLGNFKWSKHYGGSESEWGRRVMYIEDYGIFIAGYTNSFGNGAYDFYLVKTDTDGNQEWDATFGTTGWERVLDAALTRDSGVIMVGETTNTSDGKSDIYMVRTDKDGNELWSQQLGDLGDDVLTTIERFDDSTFILAGKTYVADSALCKALLFKMHENGTVEWSDTVGASGYYQINAAYVNPLNGDIAAVGMNVFPSGDTAIFESKCNATGSFYLLNQAQMQGIDYYTGIASFGTSDRFIVTQNYTNQYSYGGTDVSIAQHYNYLGWENNIGGVNYAGDELVGEVIPTSDNGAIVVGYVTQTEVGGGNVFLIKLMPNAPYLSSNDDSSTNPIVSVEPVSLSNGIRLYPNPASDVLYLQMPETGNYRLQLIDVSGRPVAEQEFASQHQLNLAGVKSGSYLVLLTDLDKGQLYRATVIVQH